MNIEFKYFSGTNGTSAKDYTRALNLVIQEKLMIDAKFLPVLEAAESGDFFAWLEMQEAFSSGTCGVPKRYDLARRYTDMICAYNRGRRKPEIESLVNSAELELESGNPERAAKELTEAAKLMVNGLPITAWNFRLFDLLYLIITSSEQSPDAA